MQAFDPATIMVISSFDNNVQHSRSHESVMAVVCLVFVNQHLRLRILVHSWFFSVPKDSRRTLYLPNGHS